jgi:hypothetical protein
MGHQRLGTLPRSREWQDVVTLIRSGRDTAGIAAATSQAAERSMVDASEDPAASYSFFLLARIPLAAREDDFAFNLRDLGLKVGDNPTLAEIVAAATEAIDRHVALSGTRTDFGEIAELSAAEAMYAVLGRELTGLFAITTADTKRAIAGFASVKQFAVLARDFFARLTRRHLDYYLSRELSTHVGPGERFPTIREHRAFEDALALHCREATRIIQEYSGEWLSKQDFEGGIDLGKAGRFVNYASKKIRDELRQRRNDNAR